MNYAEFFVTARGDSQPPHAYQCRLAGGANAGQGGSFSNGTECESLRIDVPTGLGKTAAVVLAWLWNRIHLGSEQWPRRLVYCLPMRTLVEQSERQVRGWLLRLARRYTRPRDGSELRWLAMRSPIVLVGGEALTPRRRDWDVHPEKPAILVGTQDMLLSRALHRGYGMSRYRWPIHFGLSNNDCLWVIDETQLMGVGLETTAQLAGFRERFGTLTPCYHWWMSATSDASRLDTPEAPRTPSAFGLLDGEESVPAVRRRFTAVKRLRATDTRFSAAGSGHVAAFAGEIMVAHVPGTLTLVIVNTVDRAQELYRALKKLAGSTPVLLLHSRFRPRERREASRRALESTGDRLVISTQVIEAGADVSARTLFTELAPWFSLVQRFGRCHRHGELSETGADVRWLDLPETDSSPYSAEALSKSRTLLEGLADVSLAKLADVESPNVTEPPRHVIRPTDLRDLFDTTPDIAGADLDVSRFIREDDDTDCSVFWRPEVPAIATDGPTRDELCPVPVSRLREFVGKQRESMVRTWDPLAREWVRPERFVPGREYWLDSKLGGYDGATGFDRKSKGPVVPVPGAGSTAEGHDDDSGATLGAPETLEMHTAAVVERTERLCSSLALSASLRGYLRLAAVWHDVGKAHPAFQEAIRKSNPDLPLGSCWAKSGARGRLDFEERVHFRHELASALAYRSTVPADSIESALVAFLVAAHHGKVRLSLRALPDETGDSSDPDRLFARGIWDGDELGAAVVDGQERASMRLDLSAMQMGRGPDGRPSWLESCLELRDSSEYGPFRLAYLESVLRAADIRASMTAEGAGSVEGEP